MIVLELDRELATHLANALKLYRHYLAKKGYPRPAGLLDLQEVADRASNRTQEDAGRGTVGGERTQEDADSGAVALAEQAEARELFSQSEAAVRLGRTPRSVRRMFDRGELRAVSVGGRRHVPRAELDRLISPSAPTAGDPGPPGGGRARKETTP